MLNFLILSLFSFSVFAAKANIFEKTYDDLTKNQLKSESEKSCGYDYYDEYVSSVKLRELGKDKLKKIIDLNLTIPGPLEIHKLILNKSLENYKKYSLIPSYKELSKKLNNYKKNILGYEFFYKRYHGDTKKAQVAYDAYRAVVNMKLARINKASYTDGRVADNEGFVWGTMGYASYVQFANQYNDTKESWRMSYDHYTTGLAELLYRFNYFTSLGFDDWMDSIKPKCEYPYYYNKEGNYPFPRDCYENWVDGYVDLSNTDADDAISVDEFEKLSCHESTNNKSVNQSGRLSGKDVDNKKSNKNQTNSKVKRQ